MPPTVQLVFEEGSAVELHYLSAAEAQRDEFLPATFAAQAAEPTSQPASASPTPRALRQGESSSSVTKSPWGKTLPAKSLPTSAGASSLFLPIVGTEKTVAAVLE
eukprot:4552208-Pleurochrysis_carterae.AAC.2